MLADDQAKPRPADEQSVQLHDLRAAATPNRSLNGPEPEGAPLETWDRAAISAMVRDWSAESGLTVPQFQQVYLEERVGDLLDEHPLLRRHEAERAVLLADPWLDDRAA